MGHKKGQLFDSVSINYQNNWGNHTEGQLAVDVVETSDQIIVVSTLAGAKTEDLEVAVHNDLLTIRGTRFSPVHDENVHTFHEECYWGKFSRTVVLPQEVKGELARAEYKNGVLIIRIPKQNHDRKIPVTIVEE